MSKLLQSSKVRVIALPLLSIVGTIAAMYYPLGHKAFCAGLSSVVI